MFYEVFENKGSIRLVVVFSIRRMFFAKTYFVSMKMSDRQDIFFTTLNDGEEKIIPNKINKTRTINKQDENVIEKVTTTRIFSPVGIETTNYICTHRKIRKIRKENKRNTHTKTKREEKMICIMF